MKFWKCSLTCLLFVLMSCEQKPDHVTVFEKGTLVIAGIGSDGIVIAADSRLTRVMTYDDGSIIPLWYRDSCQKIFLVQNTPMAFTGHYTINQSSLDSLIKRFNAKSQYSRESNFIHRSHFFMFSFSDKFPPDSFPNTKMYAITGGYIEDTASIVLYNYRYPFIPFPFGGKILPSDPGAIPFITKHMDTTKYYTTNQLRLIFDTVITEFSNRKPTVGGAVSVVKITNGNDPVFMQNDFSNNPLGEKRVHLIDINDSAIWNRSVR